MTIYKVWDELNAEEADARTIEASTPTAAAIAYADRDSDGHADGLYLDAASGESNPQPLSVRSPDGSLDRFTVYGMLSVDYRAQKVKEPT